MGRASTSRRCVFWNQDTHSSAEEHLQVRAERGKTSGETDERALHRQDYTDLYPSINASACRVDRPITNRQRQGMITLPEMRDI